MCWLQHDVQAHIGELFSIHVHITIIIGDLAAGKVSSLIDAMRCAGLNAAVQRQDAGFTNGKSRSRCLLPLFLFLGQSAASCMLSPVPILPHPPPSFSSSSSSTATTSPWRPWLPKVIISSSSAPGITIITPCRGGSSQPTSSRTDSDGYAHDAASSSFAFRYRHCRPQVLRVRRPNSFERRWWYPREG